MERHTVGVAKLKRLGEAVEAAFLAKASMLDFALSKPWGDSRAYDFVVDGGHGLWRVQVKCATSFRGTRCNVKAAGSGPLYTKEDIDFLVAYVVSHNLWYVVPVEAFAPRATLNFNYGPRSEGIFEIYRETWCLLACAKPQTQKGIPKLCRCEALPPCAVCPRSKGAFP